MSECQLIDAFPAFLELWPEIHGKSTDVQVEAWASVYMARWPELLAKQLADYAEQEEDWRRFARERVFPFLTVRLPAMEEAHRNLLDLCEPIYTRSQELLGFESDAIFVIYVGIGCGAGWVTTYQDLPAILFGLENMAEEGWTQPAMLSGLVAHKVGHLVHFHWRAERRLPLGSGPWWQLYTEGFAQRCEHLIFGRDTWHMAYASKGWLDWCQAHHGWLAAEFLRKIESGESLRPFFGSWYNLRGRKQTGYFLGHEVIQHLEVSMALKEISGLKEFDAVLKHEVETLARTGA